MTDSDVAAFPTGDLRSAEDAISVLMALADLLEPSGDSAYVGQLRRDAEAVARLASFHPHAQGDHLHEASVREHLSVLRSRIGDV